MSPREVFGVLAVLELDHVSPSSGMLIWGWEPDPLVQGSCTVPASHLVSPTSHPNVSPWELRGASGDKVIGGHGDFPRSSPAATGRDPPSLGDPECDNTAQGPPSHGGPRPPTAPGTAPLRDEGPDYSISAESPAQVVPCWIRHLHGNPRLGRCGLGRCHLHGNRCGARMQPGCAGHRPRGSAAGPAPLRSAREPARARISPRSPLAPGAERPPSPRLRLRKPGFDVARKATQARPHHGPAPSDPPAPGGFFWCCRGRRLSGWVPGKAPTPTAPGPTAARGPLPAQEEPAEAGARRQPQDGRGQHGGCPWSAPGGARGQHRGVPVVSTGGCPWSAPGVPPVSTGDARTPAPQNDPRAPA
ncbi:basic proline-rich protein-like [Poecile atricapillus]|uniref:basic proline-rich protein-like n=1 Tax=Poecile atricapillus TaxID=48891 RepID=UPI0027388D2F|nr:basic proline-rich protein-like [Poecile atricapillus]